jgi:hypothetical protein
MKRECRPFWEGLIDLAEGRDNAAAAGHVAGCADCAVRLAEMQRVVAAAQGTWFTAPADAVERAKALMPMRPRRRAVLVGATLAGGFARSSTEDFQITLDLGGPKMRVMVAREAAGWSLVGQAPSEAWSVSDAQGDVKSEAGGRFRILVSALGESAFVLRGPDYDVEVPAMSEMMDVRD